MHGLGFRAWSVGAQGFRVSGFVGGCGIPDLGLRSSDFVSMYLGFRLRDSGSRF